MYISLLLLLLLLLPLLLLVMMVLLVMNRNSVGVHGLVYCAACQLECAVPFAVCRVPSKPSLYQRREGILLLLLFFKKF